MGDVIKKNYDSYGDRQKLIDDATRLLVDYHHTLEEYGEESDEFEAIEELRLATIENLTEDEKSAVVIASEKLLDKEDFDKTQKKGDL